MIDVKKYLAWCLILLMIDGVSSSSVIWLNFKINQAEIAQVSCKNKARPQLACKGSCQLMKKLERNKTDRKAPLPNPENIPLLLALGWLEEPSGNPFFNRIKSKTRITGNYRLRRGVSSVPYRPPQILPS